MNRFILTALLVLVLPFSVHANTSVSTSSEGQGILSTFLRAISSLQDIAGQVTQKEIALKFEQELTFPSLLEIERVDAILLAKEGELTALEDKFKAVIERREGEFDESDEVLVESLIAEKQEVIAALQLERAEYQTRYENRKNKQQENIVLLRDSLEDLQEEKSKQWRFIRTKGTQVLNYTIIVVSLVLFFRTFQWLSGKLILKLSAHFNENRQRTLLKLNKIIFTVILVIILLGLFFSQVSTFLPFLAIIGTGLAFAVRDTISSFIAWFVIGGERGYRSGQVVGIGDVVGKVIEVKPLITVLEDRTNGYPTGKLVTFPNKVIFEGKIVHHSHNMGLVPVEVEFLLSENSDLDLAESKLVEIVTEANGEVLAMIADKSSKIIRQTPYEAVDLELKSWSEASNDGVMLRVRTMGLYGTHDDLSLEVHKQFTRWVQKNSDVFLHFTNVGRHS